MSQDQAFELTKAFIEENPAVSQALQHLDPGVEIRVLIDNRLECSLFYAENKAHLEARAAKSPDVQFILWPEGVRSLSTMPGDQMGQLGVDVVKQVVAGNIKINVCGSIWNVLQNGYLKIIKEAGPEFSGFLASHGLRSITKVIAAIRSLKS